MDWLNIIITEPWAYRAAIAAILVGIMCGVLGCFVVLRQMALIGDALSHAVLPGVVLAFVVVGGYDDWSFFVGSVLAGLATAWAITWIQTNIPTKSDAAVGIVFTFMFAIGVMGISWISQTQGVHLDLKDFLFGNVLGVSNTDLEIVGISTVLIICGIIVFYRFLFASTFQEVVAQTMGIPVRYVHYFLMLMLSFAVVSSLKTVGVILVVSLLITPASTALLLTNRLPSVIFLSGIIGSLSGVVGIVLAIVFQTTPGPAITVVLTIVYMFAAVFSPNSGFAIRWFRKFRRNKKTEFEDFLKQTLKLNENKTFQLHKLKQRLGFTSFWFLFYKKFALRRKTITIVGDKIELTPLGKKMALKLVRAHRLWETYLVNKLGLSQEQIHEDAERYEHLLTEDILDEVDEMLGYPIIDPHGSPIPLKQNGSFFTLANISVDENALISENQVSDYVNAFLWKYKLMPNSEIVIVEKSKESLSFKLLGSTEIITFNRVMAEKIHVLKA